ncbi:MAG: TusE/DsrC/DsvC family sulfur relay protein [Pseudomonadota bacterium]
MPDAHLHNIVLDSEGYLEDLNDWTPAVADQLAHAEQLSLTQAHWEIIQELRTFYQKTDTSPAMRPLVKLVKDRWGPEKGNSIYLMQLFGESPAKNAAKIAGLPRPTNCL